MSVSPPLFVVLAAGKGTRMKSAKPKVLHKIAGRSLLAHVLDAAKAVSGATVSVVVGPEMEAVVREARAVAPGAEVFVQPAHRMASKIWCGPLTKATRAMAAPE